jgi:hypothetical protein
MEIQAAGAQAGMSMLKKALEQQTFAGDLVTSTVDRLNSGQIGMTSVIKSDYLMQKTILSAAYAEQGIGTRLDTLA